MILKNTALTDMEVKALLNHLDVLLSNKHKSYALNPYSSSSQIRPYNFKEPDKFSRAQLQTLHILFESFAREATTYLATITHSGCEVDVISLSQKSYQEVIRNMPDLTILNIFSCDGLDGQAILEMPIESLFCIIEKTFGGLGGISQKIRDLTIIERKIQSTLSNAFLNIINTSFENLTTLNPKLEQIETNPQFIQQLVAPMEICMVVSLKLRISGYRNTGVINITFPFSMIEPLCPKLNSHLWFVESKSKGLNLDFREKLSDKLNSTPVEVRVEVGKATLSFDDVNKLKKGSIIVLDKDKNSPFEVYLENSKKFLAYPYLDKDIKVVKIDSVLEDNM